MEESILISIKKLLGIDRDYTEFDIDVLLHINSVLSTLTQVGISVPDNYLIESVEQKWSDFVPTNKERLIISYMYLKVRLLFDPPANSVLVQSINDQIKEYEWRLTVTVE